MMKKLISLLLAAVLLLSVCTAFADGIIGQGGTMFVYTENGKSLNVRSQPETGENIIGALAFGQKVEVVRFLDNGWAEIVMPGYTGGNAYVMSRFLSWYQQDKPAPAPEPPVNPEQEELDTEVALSPFDVVARANRSTGWVNLRLGPSTASERLARYADGTPLTGIGETTNWYKVMDPASGYVGYIRKDFITVLPMVIPQPAEPEEAQIGRLSINGDFLLKGKIPADYSLQVILDNGSHVIATLLSTDQTKPKMILNVSYNEMYGNVQKLNDLSGEDMAALKATFSGMNSVAFDERETAAGTKLLMVTETGNDADFVIFYTIYNGYEIEFTLGADRDQALTDEQIQASIDFLSGLEFIPAN